MKSGIYPVGESTLGHYHLRNLHSPIAQSSRPLLTPAYDQQELQFARAFQILREAIAAKTFPGAAVAVTWQGKLVARQGFGSFTYEAHSPSVQPDTVFDLASVSKVVATTAMAMKLYERGELDLHQPVCAIAPEFKGEDAHRGEVTFAMLLGHSSGLPAYERLFLRANTREDLLHKAFTTPLAAAPGSRAEYSDIGFIILGEALSRIAGQPLDRFCQANIFGPSGMAATCFCPPAEWKSRIPPTADDREFRHRVIQGEVQDENASVMGGVAGHAGVFASAGDVATFAQVILNSCKGIPDAMFRVETVSRYTGRQQTPAGTSRALGWDTPSQPSQSGQYLSQSSFGHLGYTGTSLWIDPEREVSITLLTNRTWPDRKNQRIKEVRPCFHDAVVEALS